MNNKGQTLLAFVLLLPIFLIFMAFVIDTGYLLKENTKLNSLTKTILKETEKYYDTSEYKEQIERLYELNKVQLAVLELQDNHLQVKETVPSIFGKLIGLKEYEIAVSYQLNKQDNGLEFIKE